MESRATANDLEERVQEIIDTADGPGLSVIVQMRSPDHDADIVEALKHASDSMRLRLPIVSARDVLPPAADQIRPPDAAAKAMRKAHGDPPKTPTEFSYLSPLSAVPQANRWESLRKQSATALQPLWSTQVVKEATKSAAPSRASQRHVSLWSSSSVVLELNRDELARLPGEIDHSRIADIYPNRVMKVPPVQKLATLPPEVTDNKAGAWGLEKTGALAAWGAYEARGRGVKVAVLDTGVDASHPDLAGKVIDFAEFTPQGGQVAGVDLTKAYDSGEHGTHCCGTIVGGNASGRWIGMAPDARVMVGLVLKEGAGSDAQILAGMEWAIANGADVISMSLGGIRWTPDVLDTYTRTIINANRLGISVVIAIGNEGSQTSGSPGNDYFAFTVGATDFQDRAAGFSGGRTQVIGKSRYIGADHLPLVYSKPDISAPGVAVYSSKPGNTWEAWNGTSMATPHVAGALALLIGELKPGIVPTPNRPYILQAMLAGSVVELGESGKNHRFGYGRLDVLRALGYAAEKGYLAPRPSPPSPATRRGGRRRKGSGPRKAANARARKNKV